VFADESGQSLRPPKARTWSRRGQTPRVLVSGKGSGRVNLAGMLDAAHQQLGGNIVLVWDNDTAHKDAAMKKLIAARAWLTVFYLPAYVPILNPVEGVWSALKRSLGNLAPHGTDALTELVKSRLRHMQYRTDGLLDGFVAETGLILEPP
jgi:hypothetical protein